MGQSKNALGAAQSLFRVFTAAGLGLNDSEGGGPYDKGTLQNAIEMLIDDGDVLLGPAHATSEAHIHTLTDQPIRH